MIQWHFCPQQIQIEIHLVLIPKRTIRRSTKRPRTDQGASYSNYIRIKSIGCHLVCSVRRNSSFSETFLTELPDINCRGAALTLATIHYYHFLSIGCYQMTNRLYCLMECWGFYKWTLNCPCIRLICISDTKCIVKLEYFLNGAELSLNAVI